MDSAVAADGSARDADSTSQASRAYHKPYLILVANYGSFYLRMGAVREWGNSGEDWHVGGGVVCRGLLPCSGRTLLPYSEAPSLVWKKASPGSLLFGSLAYAFWYEPLQKGTFKRRDPRP